MKSGVIKHGLTGIREYRIWCAMKTRCYNVNYDRYKDYGLRGIRMSDEWKNSFIVFFEDMGFAPTPNHSIDRKDPNGNYCKDNCRWATPKEQAMNKRLKPPKEVALSV